MMTCTCNPCSSQLASVSSDIFIVGKDVATMKLDTCTNEGGGEVKVRPTNEAKMKDVRGWGPAYSLKPK